MGGRLEGELLGDGRKIGSGAARDVRKGGTGSCLMMVGRLEGELLGDDRKVGTRSAKSL
jgi:hypothetical protein